MNRSRSVYRLVLAALLVAIGIMIPMTFPKLIIPPMSFTLASHVAIFLAMFISPSVAVIVSLGTTVGFVFSGLPIDVWCRALSHVVWAFAGALWLQKHPDTLTKPLSSTLFCLIIAVVHGALELLVIVSLYFGGLSSMTEKITNAGFLFVFFLVFAGSVVHSSIDYILANLVWVPLRKVKTFSQIASAK
ncbi:MAG: Substrate-specific component NiaX of predicted niacin transporter [Oscillospiraceae bacterium]|nr:Substrate-specific component NiaX of predicted niacin transporter [Oscillospiraceae bacterium]